MGKLHSYSFLSLPKPLKTSVIVINSFAILGASFYVCYKYDMNIFCFICTAQESGAAFTTQKQEW